MDRLLDAWRADPRVDATVELCAMLIRAALKAGANKILPDDFVVGFANEARQKHPTNLDVAIAVADLYLATGLMEQANAVLDVTMTLAPNDNRVKERLNKLGRRRRTQELASRSPDPETLDAPTTPLADPLTEPAGRGPPPPLPGPRRQPTAIGLPAAPPPLPPPAKIERDTKSGDAVKPSPIRDDETTRTESGVPAALAAGLATPEKKGVDAPSPTAHPRRQQTALFGSIISPVVAAPDSGSGDDGPPTKVTADAPDEGPPTSVGASARDDGPPTALTPAPVAAQAKLGLPRVGADDDDEGPSTAMTRVGNHPIPNAARRPEPGEDDGPNTAMTRVGPDSPRGEPAAPQPRPATGKGPAPRTLHSAPSPVANDDPPTQTSTNVTGLPAALAGLPPPPPPAPTIPEPPKPPDTPPAARVAARRAAVRRPVPVGRMPSLEGDQELPTKVGDQPDTGVFDARTSQGPAVTSAMAPAIARSATPIPGAQPAFGARAGAGPLFRTEPSDSHTLDEDDGSVTGVQDLPPRAPTPPPPPSDPETETQTAVRGPASVRPPPRANPAMPMVTRSAPPIPIATIDDPRSAISQISQVSQAVTNQWRPPPPPPRPAAGRAVPPPSAPPPQAQAWASPQSVVDEPSGIEMEDDDDASAVTGLREIAPLPPAGSPLTTAPRALRSTEPLKPAKPIVKGGTFAMNHSAPPPAAFPVNPPGSIPPDDEDGGARTHVLTVREAAIAAQVDPRSPHTGSGSYPPVRSNPPPAPQSAVLQRGGLLGGAAPGYASSPPMAAPAAPMFGAPPKDPPTFGAPPKDPPTFGAPPSQTFGPAAGQFLHAAVADMSFDPSYASGNQSYAPGPMAALDPESFSAGAMAAGTQVGFGQAPSQAPIAQQPTSGWPEQAMSGSFPAPPTFDARGGSLDPYNGARVDGDFGPGGVLVRAPEPARPLKLYLALGVAVLAVASLVGYATYLLLSDRSATEARESRLPDDIESALLRGTPADLARADGELRKLEASPSLAVMLGRVKHRVLVGLDVSGNAIGIEEAAAAAKQGGATADDVAFADLAAALLKGDDARARTIAEEHAALRETSALFVLVEGVMLEHAGDPAAKTRFAKAVELDARLLTARVRYARLLFLEGDIEGGLRETALLPDDHPSKPTLEALGWAARKIAGKNEPPPKLTQTSADLPRFLHPVFTALSVLSSAPDPSRTKSAEVDPQLKQAIAEADTPYLALFYGELAFTRGDNATALAAGQRALALAPGLDPALQLLGRVALVSGKLEQLEASLAPMPIETSRSLLAFVAYERSDIEKLSLLAKNLGDTDDPNGVIRTRLAILRGTSPVAPDAIERLRGADKVGGDLCAADAALDAGDLPRAKTVIDKWTDATLYPARAQRKARLFRYEGRNADAEKLLELAPNLRNTQVERILVEAESAQDRDHALSLVDDRLGEMGPFLEAYVLARKGDEEKANRKLATLKTPGFDAPLALRIAAALAFGELRDSERGETFVRVLHEKFPNNLDVNRAAKQYDIADAKPAPPPKNKKSDPKPKKR